MPALGLRLTFETAAIVGALGGAACLAAALSQRRTANDEHRTTGAGGAPSFGVRRSALVVPAAVAGVAVAAILLLPRWDHELLASGAYKYAPLPGEPDNVETFCARAPSSTTRKVLQPPSASGC
jgi:hypothetical protein